jgi:acetyl esterase/lipase
MRTVVALALAVLALSAPYGQPAQSDASESVVHRNLVYSRVGPRTLLLDLYLPRDSAAPTPVILWVHGGGWRAGSKRDLPPFDLVRHGYALASIDYRLSQEAPFPAQLEDCKAALRWLRGNAKRYNLDGDHIGAWGFSAGGHLAALLGTTGGERELKCRRGSAGRSNRVQAVCDFSGPADLAALGRDPGPRQQDLESIISRLLGGSLSTHLEQAQRASPISHISRDDAPFLIVHGDRDDVVPLRQSQRFYQALRKGHVPAEMLVVPGGGHGLSHPAVRPMVEAFFDRYLKPPGRVRGGKRPPSLSVGRRFGRVGGPLPCACDGPSGGRALV